MKNFVPIPISQDVDLGTYTPHYDELRHLKGMKTDQGNVTPLAINFLNHVIRRSEKYGFCWESQENIADYVMVTSRQVNTYQKIMVALGVIRVVKVDGGTNRIYPLFEKIEAIITPDPPENVVAFPHKVEIEEEPESDQLVLPLKIVQRSKEQISDKDTTEDETTYDSTQNNGGCTRVAETAAEKIELDESEPTAKPPRPDIPDHQRWKYEYDGTPKGGDAATQEQADGHMLRLWQNLGRADKVREIEERIARKET